MSEKIYLSLHPTDEDAKFETHARIPRWAFMKLTVAQKKQDDVATLAAVYDLLNSLIVSDEKVRFDEYLSEHDEAFDYLMETGLAEVIEAVTNYPKAPLNSSLESSPTEEPVYTSQVVSFQQATDGTV